MLKRFTLLAALAACSVFILGAAPGSASAANCSTYNDGTYYANYQLNFSAVVTGCTGVDKVQWGDGLCYSTGCVGAWWDFPYSRIILGNQVYGALTQNIYNNNAYWVTYGTNPWCGGQSHSIYTFFWYRIHNAVTGTWGSWHQSSSGTYWITC